MKVADIIVKIENRLDVYEIFQPDKLEEAHRWLDMLSELPAGRDIEIASEKDILDELAAHGEKIFFTVVPGEAADSPLEDVEGFQAVNPADFEEAGGEFAQNEQGVDIALLSERNEMLQNINNGLTQELDTAATREKELLDQNEMLRNIKEGLARELEEKSAQIAAPQPPVSQAPQFTSPAVPMFGQRPDEEQESFTDEEDEFGDSSVYPASFTAPQADQSKKNKKRMIAVVAIVATVVLMGGSILLPMMLKKPHKGNDAPAAGLSVPAQPAPVPPTPAVPVQTQASSSRSQNVVPVAPSPAPAKPAIQPAEPKEETIKQTKKIHEKKTVKKEEKKQAKTEIRAKRMMDFEDSGMEVPFPLNKFVRVYLASDEILSDTGIRGEDTVNWSVSYNKGQKYISICARREGKNTIVFTTNKRTYLIKAGTDEGASAASIQFR